MSCPFNTNKLRPSDEEATSHTSLEKNQSRGAQINNSESETFNNKKEKNRNLNMYLLNRIPDELKPKKPKAYLDWWETDSRTKNHARFCLPLIMGNKLGYELLSPCTFEIEWDGNENSDALISFMDGENYKFFDGDRHIDYVTNHSAHGSFTIQSRIITKSDVGYFTYIKGLPNIRRKFSVMEGLIESWWNPSTFGIVCLCNSAGKFRINIGEPIARIMLLNEESLNFNLEVLEMSSTKEEFPYAKDFEEKRKHQKEKVVLDYFKGLYPDGEKVNYHFKPKTI